MGCAPCYFVTALTFVPKYGSDLCSSSLLFLRELVFYKGTVYTGAVACNPDQVKCITDSFKDFGIFLDTALPGPMRREHYMVINSIHLSPVSF